MNRNPIVDLVAREGGISIERYMRECVAARYAASSPVGADGDFVTAPEISAMFGEMIAAWCCSVRKMMSDGTRRVRLLEAGPGRGVLIADVMRTIGKMMPDFRREIDVVLLENSPSLRGEQRRRLSEEGVDARWIEDIDSLEDIDSPVDSEGSLIVLANEFFDALPTRPYRFEGCMWRELFASVDGERIERRSSSREVEERVRRRLDLRVGGSAGEGDVVELSPIREGVMRRLCSAVSAVGGALLVIDYGGVDVGAGDTLQAASRHRRTSPFERPGEADLSSHVDFSSLIEAAFESGARPCEVLEQGEFLRAMGIERRAEALMRSSPRRSAEVIAALRRLVHDDYMGRLFRVLAATDASLSAPYPFRRLAEETS